MARLENDQGKEAQTTLSDAAFLRSLAQNDYMIDQYFLPNGDRLNDIASLLERQAIELDDLTRQFWYNNVD